MTNSLPPLIEPNGRFPIFGSPNAFIGQLSKPRWSVRPRVHTEYATAHQCNGSTSYACSDVYAITSALAGLWYSVSCLPLPRCCSENGSKPTNPGALDWLRSPPPPLVSSASSD